MLTFGDCKTTENCNHKKYLVKQSTSSRACANNDIGTKTFKKIHFAFIIIQKLKHTLPVFGETIIAFECWVCSRSFSRHTDAMSTHNKIIYVCNTHYTDADSVKLRFFAWKNEIVVCSKMNGQIWNNWTMQSFRLLPFPMKKFYAKKDQWNRLHNDCQTIYDSLVVLLLEKKATSSLGKKEKLKEKWNRMLNCLCSFINVRMRKHQNGEEEFERKIQAETMGKRQKRTPATTI